MRAISDFRRVSWLLLAFLAACAQGGGAVDPRLSGPSATDLEQLTATRAQRPVIARAQAEAPDVAHAAAGVAAGRIGTIGALKNIQISAIPYLRRSPEGALFLTRAGHRALVRGAPADHCPAAAVSAPGAASAEVAAQSALTACFAQLAARGAGADCGCQVLAVDRRLTAPVSAFAFAPGVSAYLIQPEGAVISGLIAESELAADGAEMIRLRHLFTEIGLLRLTAESAALVLADHPGVVFRGVRAPFGYRRGRLAERISLTGPDGEKLSLLIGVERRDALASN